MSTNSVTPALVAALDAAWQAVRSRHRDVPEVVLTLRSGTEAGPPRNGHYAPGCWHRGSERLPELFISGEGLKRGSRGGLSTVIHEAAHGVADSRGIQDTSRQGRWHNTRFRVLAEELGLTVEKVEGLGWSKTTVPDGTAAIYAAELDGEVLLSTCDSVWPVGREPVPSDGALGFGHMPAARVLVPRRLVENRAEAAAGGHSHGASQGHRLCRCSSWSSKRRFPRQPTSLRRLACPTPGGVGSVV